MLVKLDNKNSHQVAEVLAGHIKTLAEQVRRTLTWDRGVE